MDFSNIQSRISTPYIPPHRTQLHPRMHSFSHPHPNSKLTNNRNKLLVLSACLLIIPSLYYLFSTAQKVHQSDKFAEPNLLHFYGIVIDVGPAVAQVRVFKFLGEGQTPFVDLMKEKGDVDWAIEGLIGFAKKRVPKKEWGSTKVQLLANGGLGEEVLDKCRRVLRASGFAFKDSWVREIQGKEKGMYAWIAANYVLGTLGGKPESTLGIVELGGASLKDTIFCLNDAMRLYQILLKIGTNDKPRGLLNFMPNCGHYILFTYAMRERPPAQSSKIIRFAGVYYNIYMQSLPEFGQDAAWKSVHELQNSSVLKSFPSSSWGIFDNPCIPKGYELTSDPSNVNLLKSHPAGNFTACRFEALAVLKRIQDKCLHAPCQTLSSFFAELQGKPVSPENFFYTSELYGVAPSASLSELEAFGRHYCENDWDKLKKQHRGVDDLDLLRYCFFSAYTVALLHDSLEIPMRDKRIVFVNQTESIPLDWTLGAFIFLSMQEPPELEHKKLDKIVGNESVTYFSLFAFLLIAILATIFVLQWRKPQFKTIYDLEKGRYIVTRFTR